MQQEITSGQMLEAPLGAFYIWPNDKLHYPKRLARWLDRGDLKVVSPGWLVRDVPLADKLIILDHETVLEGEGLENYRHYLARVERKSVN